MAGKQGLKSVGRPPILCDSVQNIVDVNNYYAQIIHDRSQPIADDFVEAILNQSVMTWEGRSPSPALNENGDFVGTDLDLCSFLVPIAARGAVIQFPEGEYKARRAKSTRADQHRIKGAGRFGKVTGLISNRNVFSFSVRIFDQSVVTTSPEGSQETGDHRNFMLVDIDGKWHSGWRRIVWDPTAEENEFLTANRLWTGNVVQFQNWVHPNRWASVFSAHYLLKKWLLARIEDEKDWCNKETELIKSMGCSLPPQPPTPPREEGPEKKISVKTIEIVLDIPEFIGQYQSYPISIKGLKQAHDRRRHLLYTVKPMIQFIIRANEAAYFLHGNVQNDTVGRIAHWLNSRKWESDWKPPRGRVAWNRMRLSSDFNLRYRIKTVIESVAV